MKTPATLTIKLTLLCVFLSLFSILSYAAIPHLIRYQGSLVGSDGQLVNDAKDLTFRIYSQEEGTNPSLWNETQQNITVSNGIFNVLLGEVTALDIDFGQDLWLTIEVDTQDGTNELSPRQRISSTPFAFVAERVAGDYMHIDSDTGNVGIGTITPAEKLDVNGNINVSGTINSTGNISSAGDITATGTVSSAGQPLLTQTDAEVIYVKKAGDNITGDLNVSGNIAALGIVTSAGDPLLTQAAAETAYVNVSGDNITGDLNVSGNIAALGIITSAGDPLLTQAAAEAAYVNVSGDNITGDITVNGNIGIGVSNPVYPLDVSGILNASDIYKGGSAFNPSQWVTSGSGIYYDAGNVGIGTTSPQATLEVANADSSTVLLLHMNEDFTDEIGKTVTANGNAQIDTAQSEFGGASALFDGTGDYLSIPDHDDWNFGSGDFTIDFWVRFNNVANDQSFYMHQTDGNNYYELSWRSGELRFMQQVTSVNNIIVTPIWAPNVNTWYHLACVKSGNDFKWFVDGIQTGATITDTDPVENFTGLSYIGSTRGVDTYLDGWLDEFRISKGIARWTEDFTPPASEYTYGNAAVFNGKVGIGTATPSGKLEIKNYGNSIGFLLDQKYELSSGSPSFYVYSTIPQKNATTLMTIGMDHSDSSSTAALIRQLGSGSALKIDNNGDGEGIIIDQNGDGTALHIDNDGVGYGLIVDGGNVGIGTANPQGILDVNGTIYQRGSLLHADYVFEDGYDLESIEKHAVYMWEEKHLKAVPKTVVDENNQDIVEIGAHNRGILEELEKAHVYIQQLNEKIKALEKKIKELEK